MTAQGAEIDDAISGDLQQVGARAASTGSPLPELLVILRISRDIVVQTALELAEAGGRAPGLGLSLLLTRLLPAMDRLTDALSRGYWTAILGREEAARARYQHIVDRASAGVYDVDLDGRIVYANSALADILGQTPDRLVGAQLSEMLAPSDPILADALLSATGEGTTLQVTVSRPDGARRTLDVRTLPRREEGRLVGLQGIVYDGAGGRDLGAG